MALRIHPHHLAQLEASGISIPPTPELSPSSSMTSFSSFRSRSSSSDVPRAKAVRVVDVSSALQDLRIHPNLDVASKLDPPQLRRPTLRVLQPSARPAPPVKPGGAGMKRSYSLPVPTAVEVEQRRRLVDEDRARSAPLQRRNSPSSAPASLDAMPARSVPSSVRWGSTSTFTPSVRGMPSDFPNPHGYSQSHLATHRPLNRSASYSQAEVPGVPAPVSPARRTLSACAGVLLCPASLESAVSDSSDTEAEPASPTRNAYRGLLSDTDAPHLSSSFPSLEPSFPASYFSSSPAILEPPATPVKRSGRVTVSPFAGYSSTLASVPGSPSAPDARVFVPMSVEKKRAMLGRSRTIGVLQSSHRITTSTPASKVALASEVFVHS